MQRVQITVKNYRCFEDSSPAVFMLGDGLTAFVGPNNSGKSSILKFFYEFKNVWQNLPGWIRGFPQQKFNASFTGVTDPSEVFCDANDRPLTIQFDWPDLRQALAISRFILTIDRNFVMTGEVAGPNNTGVASWNSAGTPIDPVGRGLAFAHVDEMLAVFAMGLYIGPFRNAITEGQTTYFDLDIGTRFIGTWDAWKTGPVKIQNRAIQQVQEEIRSIFGYTSLEVSASENRTLLHLDIDKRPYKAREVGAGLSQFIVVLANAAIKKPRLLLIDEPELHLHPALQVSFLTALAAYASDGLVYASHSIGLARSTAERLYSVQRIDGRSTVREFGQIPNFAEFAGELSFSTFKEMGFETILLVEGVTELKAFQHFLRLLNADKKVVVIPLAGANIIKANADEMLGELGRLSDDVAVLVDSERTSKGAPISASRADFLKACETLGFRAKATDRRAFENYLPERAIKAQKGHNFRALGPYESLAQMQPNWPKHENWRIARLMTKEEVLSTDIGEFLRSVVAD